MSKRLSLFMLLGFFLLGLGGCFGSADKAGGNNEKTASKLSKAVAGGTDLIVNGGFDSPTGWTMTTTDTGYGFVTIGGGQVHAIVSGNMLTAPDNLYLKQGSINVTAGKTYTIKYSAQVLGKTSREIGIAVKNGASSVFDKVEAINGTMAAYQYQFTASATQTVEFVILLGKAGASYTPGGHDIFIDNVQLLESGGSGNTNTLTISSSAATVKIGESVKLSGVIKDSAGNIIPGTIAYTANGAALSGDLFAPSAEGVYTISGKSGDIVSSNTISVTAYTGGVPGSDLIKNGKFDTGSDWEMTTNDTGFGFVRIEANQIHAVASANAMTKPDNLFLKQRNIALSSGKKYTLKFDMRSSMPRPVSAVIQDSAAVKYLDFTANLTSEMKTYTVSFNMTSTTLTEFNIFMGKTGTFNPGGHDMFIDNIQLVEEAPLMELTVNKEILMADGVDTVEMTLKKNGAVVIDPSAEYYADGVKLTGKTYMTTVLGTHILSAKYEGTTVTKNITAEKPSFKVSATPLKITFGQKSKLTAVKNGVTLSTGVTYYAGTTQLAGDEFSSTTEGIFNIKAKYEGFFTENSVDITVTKDEPLPPLIPIAGDNHMTLQFANNTNGKWSDSQIFVQILARDINKNMSHLEPNGTLVPLSMGDNKYPKNGRMCFDHSKTLEQLKTLGGGFQIPKHVDSGRIFISYGSPMYMQVVSGGDGIGFAAPDLNNDTDPNRDVYFDWAEFAVVKMWWEGNKVGLWINTTQVDQFCAPMTIDVFDKDSSDILKGIFNTRVGITETRNDLYSAFNIETPVEFHGLSTEYRINAPCKDKIIGFGQIPGLPPAKNYKYMDSYINEMWSYFSANDLKFNMDFNGVTHHITGRVHGETFRFTSLEGQSGTIARKPTTTEVFEASGVMATGNTFEGAVQARIDAAMNRHVLKNPAEWADDTKYYKEGPCNYFAKFWHDHSINGRAYGFAYDDVEDKSSTIHSNNARAAIIGLGW